MTSGTYIIQTKGVDGPEFRIVHTHSIDNIYGPYESGSYLPDPQMFVTFLNESEVHDSLDKAWDKATLIDFEAGLSDYGVNLITDFANYSYEDVRAKTETADQ